MDNEYSPKRETTDILYGSSTYFNMVNNYPDIGRYLSLGKKVSFCIADQCFNIGESGISNTTVVVPATMIPGTREEKGVLSQTIIIVGSLLVISVGVLFWGRAGEKKSG